jgi:hypothetical protein
MKTKYILIALFGIMIFAGSASAQISPAVVAPVSVAVMSPADPGTLPSSPFYFLKEWRRSLQRVFSFGSEAKADTELKISEEKAVELKTMKETEPQNITALTKALANYKKSQERLKTHFENLEEKSNNQKVDKLVEKFTDAAVRHEELFKSLIEKAEKKDEGDNKEKSKEKDDFKKAVSASQGSIEDVAAVAATKSQVAEQAVLKIQERLMTTTGSPEEYCNRVQVKVAELNKLFSENKIEEKLYNTQKRIIQQMLSGCSAVPTNSFSETNNGEVIPEMIVPADQIPQVLIETPQDTGDTPTTNNIINSIKNILPMLKSQNLNMNKEIKVGSQSSADFDTINGGGNEGNPMIQPAKKVDSVNQNSSGMGM